jgi:hypothetical protein
MLDVVVIRVTLVEAGILAVVQTRHVRERLDEVTRSILLVKFLVDAADSLGYHVRVRRIDAVGDVVIVASIRFSCHSAPAEIQEFLDRIMRVLDYNEIVRAMLDNVRKPIIFPGNCAVFHKPRKQGRISVAYGIR